MKNLLFIFLLFPLLVFGQAEKTHRSIIIDSIKAFNGGIIDVKDTLKQDIGIKFNDGTFQSTAAVGGADGDGIYDGNGSLTSSTTVTMALKDLTFSTTGSSSSLFINGTSGFISIGTTVSDRPLTIKRIGTTNGITIFDGSDIRNVELREAGAGGRLDLYNVSGARKTVLSTDPGEDSFMEGDLHIGGVVNATASHFQVTGSNSKDAIRVQDDAGVFRFALQAKNTANGQGGILSIASGIASPLTTIKLIGNGTSFFNGGNVGIGLDIGPSARLQVSGIDATSANFAFDVTNNVGTKLFRVRNDGNIGIGTITPNAKLVVIGDVVSNTYNFAADIQADDDYEIDIPDIVTLTTGLMAIFTANTANTGGVTLEITSVGDLDAILKLHDQALVTGDIEAGQVIVCVFDGTNWQMISQLAQ